MPFLRRVRQAYPDKTIWCFTGFTYEELTTDGTHPRCEVTDEMLSLLDVLVDGRFVEELKDITLRFRGSSNQRLIDLNASRAGRDTSASCRTGPEVSDLRSSEIPRQPRLPGGIFLRPAPVKKSQKCLVKFVRNTG